MNKIRFFFNDLINFFVNIYKFRIELRDFYWWDYNVCMLFIKRCLTIMANGLENKGIEISEHRLERVNQIRETIKAIEYYLNDSCYDDAKKSFPDVEFSGDTIIKYGKEVFINKTTGDVTGYFGLCSKLEEENWSKIWDTINAYMQGWWD